MPRQLSEVNDICSAESYLGELWLKMGKLDEADDILKKAMATRNNYDFTGWDAGVTRENLGQVYEAKGDLAEARSIRKSGAPNAICCGFYYVRADLNTCRIHL